MLFLIVEVNGGFLLLGNFCDVDSFSLLPCGIKNRMSLSEVYESISVEAQISAHHKTCFCDSACFVQVY